MRFFLIVCLITLIGFSVKEVSSIRITKVDIPAIYYWNKTEVVTDLKLNCDYEIDESDSGFVLKWFFNDRQIYNWIPSAGGSNAWNEFKHSLDLNYTSSDDKFYKHRTLVIAKPKATFSGEYVCHVRTLNHEERKGSKLQIIVPSVNFSINYEENEDDEPYIVIKCSANDVVPETNLNIIINDEVMSNTTEKQNNNGSSGLIKASNEVRLNKNMLTVSTDIFCKLTIPDTSYVETCKVEYLGELFTALGRSQHGKYSTPGSR